MTIYRASGQMPRHVHKQGEVDRRFIVCDEFAVCAWWGANETTLAIVYPSQRANAWVYLAATGVSQMALQASIDAGVWPLALLPAVEAFQRLDEAAQIAVALSDDPTNARHQPKQTQLPSELRGFRERPFLAAPPTFAGNWPALGKPITFIESSGTVQSQASARANAHLNVGELYARVKQDEARDYGETDDVVMRTFTGTPPIDDTMSPLFTRWPYGVTEARYRIAPGVMLQGQQWWD